MIYRPLAMCNHLAVELSTEPQSTAPSTTATKGATHPTKTQRTVERDQRRTTCDWRPPQNRWNTIPGQEDSRHTQKIEFSSWAKVGEDALDEAAPHHLDRTYSVKTWARLYGCHMLVISGTAYTDQRMLTRNHNRRHYLGARSGSPQ